MQVITCLYPMAERQDHDALFKALADPSRRKLLDLLHAHDGRTLNELCETNVVVPLLTNIAANSSTRARLSQNTRRFSPRCIRAMTVAAF